MDSNIIFQEPLLPRVQAHLAETPDSPETHALLRECEVALTHAANALEGMLRQFSIVGKERDAALKERDRVLEMYRLQEQAGSKRWTYLKGAEGHTPENCPTYYDGCNCTVEALEDALQRAASKP